MDKVWVVCRREFGTQIRKLSFWLTTLGVPLFLVGMALVVGIVGFFAISRASKKEPETKNLPLGVVDQVGAVDFELLLTPKTDSNLTLADPDVQKVLESVNMPAFVEERVMALLEEKAPTKRTDYLMFGDKVMAEKALEEKTIRGYLLLGDGFPETSPAQIVWFDRKQKRSVTSLERHVRNQLLVRSMDESAIPKVLFPLRDASVTYRFEPEAPPLKKRRFDFDFSAIGLPFLFAFAMMMVTMFSADRLLRGLVEEKQNRVIEILLSSVSADQLLAGKVLGLGLIGLVQLAIWTLLAFIPASLAFTFFTLDGSTLFVCLLLFLLGYFQLATLILGLGSMGNTFQEASQWSMICSLLAMSPMMLWPLVFQDLDSGLVEFFTYFPLTSPLIVMLRYGVNAISIWEVLVSVLILIVSNFIAVKFGAKLFRLGILLTGKTPSPRTVWRMLRAS